MLQLKTIIAFTFVLFIVPRNSALEATIRPDGSFRYHVNVQCKARVEIISAKWEQTSTSSLSQVQVDINKMDKDKTNDLVRKCNGKSVAQGVDIVCDNVYTLPVTDQRKIEKMAPHLSFKVKYECGWCPNQKFLEKHVLPGSISSESQVATEWRNRVEKYAQTAENERERNNWATTTTATIFAGIGNSQFQRDGGNRCKATRDVWRYQCEKGRDGWGCTKSKKKEIAIHDTTSGHYQA
ncbi:hypothetical protein HA402_002313 [Bradysia odoriphaga]|nr:hypothetical protein HA402_002313 [Bradysia odoriphaga]